MTMPKQYTVVENAGYEGEQDILSFPRLREALDYIKSHYDHDEVDSLHVQIAVHRDGERTYEY